MTKEKVIPWGWEGDGILAWLGAGDGSLHILCAAGALLSVLLGLCVAMMLDAPSRRLDVALGSVVAMGCLTHYFFAFSVGGLLVWLWLDPGALFAQDWNGLFAALDRGLASPEHAEFVARLAARRRA